MSNYDLEDAIIMLHNVARTIERELGYGGTLSNDVRKCADKLNEILQPLVLTGESDEAL